MKTDLFTKTILTVIAAALITIAFQNFTTEAVASKSVVNSFASVPVNDDGSINVKMTDVMDINISKVGGSSLYGSLPVNLKEMNGSSLSSYGLPVNIYAVGGSSVYGAVPVKTN